MGLNCPEPNKKGYQKLNIIANFIFEYRNVKVFHLSSLFKANSALFFVAWFDMPACRDGGSSVLGQLIFPLLKERRHNSRNNTIKYHT